jgi:pseudouridine synthase
MKTDNEKRGGNSGRDGNFAKRDVKSILKNVKKFGKPNVDNSSRNDRQTENKYDSPRSEISKPRVYNNNTDNNFGNRDNRNERNERPNFGSRSRNNNYQNRSEKPYVKRYNQDEDTNRKIIFRKKEDVEANREGRFIETRFDNKKDGISFRKPRAKDPNYDPNAKYSHKKQMEYKQEFVDPTKPVRLNKFLANAGICSRREADEYIAAGVISVNGQVVSELGVKVLPTDKVMFHEQPVQSERKVYLLLNKPKDCITTSEDKHAKLTVLDLVKNACSERIYPVGRLDRNTTGVLLLTNDGDLASKLTHPKYEKKKIYQVVLNNALSEEDFKAILSGIELEDGVIAADALEYLENGRGKQIGIEIHSGKNRVVRRIFDKLGYKVMRLDRVYFAGLTKKSVPRGKYRFLNEREVSMLKMGAHE